jgi:hypothetical protein
MNAVLLTSLAFSRPPYSNGAPAAQLRSVPDDKLKERGKAEIAEPDDRSDDKTEHKYRDSIHKDLSLGGPGHFFKLGSDSLKEGSYLGTYSFEDIRLLFAVSCHNNTSLTV